MLEFGQLRCFVAVAEELHFGRAAARLNMTQPPVSRQIQVLERVLDAQLLDRTSRSVQLTAAGRSFLPEAQLILRLAAAATHHTRQVAAGRTGTLRLGFTAASSYDLLPRLAMAFRSAHPEAALSLREMVSKDQVEALLLRQIDAGLVRPPIAHPDLLSIKVLSEPMVAAVPSGSPLAARPALRPTDFDREPFIGYAPNEAHYFHDLVAVLFTEAGVHPRIVEQLTQIHSILALVRATLGTAIVPTAAKRLRFEGVTFVSLVLARERLAELHLVWRRDCDNPLLDGLNELLRIAAAS